MLKGPSSLFVLFFLVYLCKLMTSPHIAVSALSNSFPFYLHFSYFAFIFFSSFSTCHWQWGFLFFFFGSTTTTAQKLSHAIELLLNITFNESNKFLNSSFSNEFYCISQLHFRSRHNAPFGETEKEQKKKLLFKH